ncbi:MAG: hypothetical protein JKX87_03325 [Cycloclasticus sp.]|nr:hypothetical protein [Cycloclasticus sp.]
MKKVMFLIVGMLFAVSVNAATLTLTGAVGNAGAVKFGSGNLVTADWSSSQNSGETINDVYTVTTDALSGGYLSVTFNPLTPGSTVSLFDGNSLINLAVNAVGPNGSASYFWVLAANTVYNVYIDITNAVAASNYDLRIATPIPAALFLFAPALLGFFGLRRKAAVAA